jgi:hypothetical protein
LAQSLLPTLRHFSAPRLLPSQLSVTNNKAADGENCAVKARVQPVQKGKMMLKNIEPFKGIAVVYTNEQHG